MSQSQGDDLQAAVRYLDELDRMYAGTVSGAPPMPALVESLTLRFGSRLTGSFAHRLAQGAESGWQTTAALAYLEHHRDPATTEPLIRFAAETPSAGLQTVVAQILAGFGDPALAAKIAAEGARLAGHGRALPPALASLSSPVAGTVA